MGKGIGTKGKSAGGGAVKGPVEKKVFTEERVRGYISQWQQTWGWVVPQQKIQNVEGKFLNSATNPRIYFHINDSRSGSQKAEGDEISFFLYKDERGIGATDVALRSEEEEGGEEMAEEGTGEEAVEGAEGEGEEEEATEEAGTWAATPATALAARTPKMAAAPPKGSMLAKAKAVVSPAKAKAAITVQPKAATATELPKLSFTTTSRFATKRRFKGKVNKWSGVFGWITPTDTLPEDLKSALMRFNSGIYTNWRHLQQGIKMDAGLAVDFTVESDENGLVAMDVGTTMKAGVNNDPFAEVQKALGGSIGSLKAELERAALQETSKKQAALAQAEEAMEEEQQEQAETYEQEAEAEEEQAPAEEESWGQESYQETGGEEETPLPPGWEAIWSDEHESYYYWHKASKTPAWERPTAPIKVATPPPKAKAGAKAAGKGKDESKGKGKDIAGKAGKTKAGKQPVQEESYEEEAEAYEEEQEAPNLKRKGAPMSQDGKGAFKNQAWKGGGKKQKSWF